MMKIGRFVIKIVGACLAITSIICFLIGFWDQIAEKFMRLNRRFGSVDIVVDENEGFVDVV